MRNITFYRSMRMYHKLMEICCFNFVSKINVFSVSWINYRSNFIFKLLLSHVLLNLVDIHDWCWMRSDAKIDVRQLTYVNIFWMWETVTYFTWSTTMLSGAQFSQHLSHWHVEHRDWTEQSCSSSIAYRLWLFHLIQKNCCDSHRLEMNSVAIAFASH